MGASIGKRGRGIPMPIMPTENIGMMSGAIRKKRGDKRDKRGSRRAGIFGGSSVAQVTLRDPKTGRRYGGMVKDGVPQFEKPDFVSDEDFNKSFPKLDSRVVDKIPGLTPMKPKPTFDPSKPSAVQETTRVNVQDPTLGGPPEREVPIPKERRPRITRESDPRGPAPFAPDDNAAKDRFFETMFERAANQKERRAIDKGERRDRQEAMRDEARMRDSEMGGRRRGRRDFTRRRPERRRSREERAAFRDRYVSTLGSNFFS
jgi:hypothetical protein|tara:strand:- start:477 stop:1256 length:780 start_codon:yes stop_codon:yes gene_type:complete